MNNLAVKLVEFNNSFNNFEFNGIVLIIIQVLQLLLLLLFLDMA
jgi:hypothetical protein